MADNVAITAGSGTSIATDDVAGNHYQRVKLVDGTLDSTTAIAAGGGVEAGALRVTLANDSTGVVSVDDNGASLTVDVGTALPAGSNAIGKLAANSGVDIGDVDVTSVTPGTGATNLGKAEDAAHSTGDTGVAVLGVRRDTAASGAGADGDYATLNLNANGRLYTSATVDAALPAGTNNIGDVDVLSLPAIPAGTNNIGDVDVLSIAAGDNNIGNVDIVTVPAPLSTTGNGTAATALRVSIASDSTGQVALAAGSAAIGKLAANSGVDIGDVDVTSVITGTGATNLGKAEDAAHSSGDVGVQVLAVRKDTAAALAGTDGDYAPLEVDAAGRLHVLNLPFERTLTIVTGTAASSGDNSLIAAPGVGVKIVVCGFVIQNESSTATTLILRDGTTSKIRCYAKNQGDGLSQVFTPDARWKLTANTALNLNLSGANTCGYTVWYYTE